MRRQSGVYQSKKRDAFPVFDQAVSEFENDEATERVASQSIRTSRLDLPNLGQLILGHLLDTSVRLLPVSQTARPESIHTSFRRHVSGQRREHEHIAGNTGHEEERLFGACLP